MLVWGKTQLKLSLVVIDDSSGKCLVGIPLMEDHFKTIDAEQRQVLTKCGGKVEYRPAERSTGQVQTIQIGAMVKWVTVRQNPIRSGVVSTVWVRPALDAADVVRDEEALFNHKAISKGKWRVGRPTDLPVCLRVHAERAEGL